MIHTEQHTYSKSGIRDYISKILHWAYTAYILGTVGSFCYAYFGLKLELKDIWIARTLSIGLVVFIIILFLFLIYFALTYSEKARYAEITANLHETQHLIRDLTSLINKHKNQVEQGLVAVDKNEIRKKIVDDFSRILTQIVEAMSITKGVNCRSAIKTLGRLDPKSKPTPDTVFVRTLARDLGSAHTCKEKDESEEKNHLISENTDFNHIFKKIVKYFFTGDVTKDVYYLNSSKTFWEKSNPSLIQIRNWIPFVRKVFTIYPYRSVMVFPIKESHGSATDDMPLLGFLCIDSKSKNCFNPRYDVDLGASFADSLYHVLKAHVMLMVLLTSPESAHA